MQRTRVVWGLAMAVLLLGLTACGGQPDLVGDWSESLMGIFRMSYYEDGTCYWFTVNEGCTWDVAAEGEVEVLTLHLLQDDGTTTNLRFQLTYRDGGRLVTLSEVDAEGNPAGMIMTFARDTGE